VQALPFCINIQCWLLPWWCLYLQHLLTVLIESCTYSLFVLESQCQNGLSLGLMQILKEVGYWAQGKHLLHALSQGLTIQWLVRWWDLEWRWSEAVLGHQVTFDRSNVEPFIHSLKEWYCSPSIHLVSHSHWLLLSACHQLAFALNHNTIKRKYVLSWGPAMLLLWQEWRRGMPKRQCMLVSVCSAIWVVCGSPTLKYHNWPWYVRISVGCRISTRSLTWSKTIMFVGVQ